MNIMATDIDRKGLSLQMSPEKPKIQHGEPCVLILRFSNNTDLERAVDFGTDGVGAFTFQMLDANGKEITKGTSIQRMGMSRLWKQSVPAHGAIVKRLVLNQWCSTLVPKGTYKIVCRWVESDSFSIESDCFIDVLPPNEEELRKIFADILHVVFSNTSRTEKAFTLSMLVYSRSTIAIPYLSKVVGSNELEDEFRIEAIQGLERIATSEATAELVAIAKGKRAGGLPDSIKDKIIGSLFRLSESGRPEITQACEEITSKVNRPKKSTVRD